MASNNGRLILASASPRRRELLARFAHTEAIDEEWPGELAALEAAPLPAAPDPRPYRRIYEYFFFRQIEKKRNIRF